jgi:ribulose-phosphate 3-epimerase
MDRILMAPSILSADFTRLADAIGLAERAGADLIHVDVMDGHFVPNLTIGPPVIKALKGVSTAPLDVHLMIDNPEATVEWYLDAGADMVTVHAEAAPHLHRLVQVIRAAGAKPGVSINPATPVDVLRDILPDLYSVLVMSVNPGFGGQSFIEASVGRVARLAALIRETGSEAVIEVDGGITAETAPLVAAAGARMLVAGNAVFGDPDPIASGRPPRVRCQGRPSWRSLRSAGSAPAECYNPHAFFRAG